MPRPKSGLPPKSHYRRAPAWCAELTALVEKSAQLAKVKRVYLTHSLEWGGQINTAGVVQAVLIQMALHLSEVTDQQWKQYVDGYAQMIFTGTETKGIVFDQQSLNAFHEVGEALSRQPRRDDVKLTWRGEYHYPDRKSVV